MNPGTERYVIAWIERNMKLTEELQKLNERPVIIDNLSSLWREMIENKTATLEETEDFTHVNEDFVWCDHEGTIHGAEPDPYDYGSYVCPGPHSVVLIGDVVDPLPGEVEAREHT